MNSNAAGIMGTSIALLLSACASEDVPSEQVGETEDAVTVTVTNKESLLSALASASRGTVIRISPSASINLTGHRCGGGQDTCLKIPAGVTLDGGRSGDIPGALLFTNDTTDLPDRAGWTFLSTAGEGVTLRNLRLRGPDGTIGNAEILHATGIALKHDRATVEGSEIYNWPAAAISVGGRGALVQRNYIHHNIRAERGYGVVTGDNAQVLVQYNIFDANRHAVAGSSGRDAKGWFEVRYNTVGAISTHHVFDMHGSNESLRDNSSNAAGDTMYVHHNRIYASQPSVLIRGVPQTHAWVESNCAVLGGPSFAYQSEVTYPKTSTGSNCTYDARLETYVCRSFQYAPNLEEMSVSGNITGASRATCDALPNGTGPSWCVASTKASRELAPAAFELGEVLTGDFDGDGSDEVLRSNGEGWRQLDVTNKKSMWIPGSASAVHARDLAIGDFNGDGKSDALASWGGVWRVQWSATGGWSDLNTQAEPTKSLRVGDFDGDGKSDVLVSRGARLLIAYAGRGELQVLNTTGPEVIDLVVGDFNGDGKSDLLWATGTEWRISSGGASPWTKANGSAVRTADMLIGDFNGDGKDDALGSWSGNLQISSGARTGWKPLRPSNASVVDLRVLRKKNAATELLISGCN